MSIKKSLLKPGTIIWIEGSKFPHVITYIDPYDCYFWCRPIGAVDTREKRKHVYEVDRIDDFMTEVYAAKQEKCSQEAASAV